MKARGKPVRCAIYTRKSSEEGLDQSFNSLDAQREAGLDYVKSQKHAGWQAIKTMYDDGGYSGGSVDRPGLQKLLDDIRKGRIDVVVVYKVDRLSRSLADFAHLMRVFDEHRVSFVSVTQQFNTTTSMGRLTLNMLLSFAQFEREVTGERIRDKIAATKRKGVWVGGRPPLGYRLPREEDPGFSPGDRVLRIVESEATLVRAIFDGYLELGSLIEVAARLNAQGHTTRRWLSSRGKEHGGRPLTSGFIHRVLTNPIYIGKITHVRGRNTGSPHTEVYEGLHDPIIDRDTWDRVRSKMDTVIREPRHRWTHSHLLKGKLRTFEGHAMSPSSVQRPISKRGGATDSGKRIVRYYVSQKALKHGFRSCQIKSINAAYIDDLVRALVTEQLDKRHGVRLGRQDRPIDDHWTRRVIDQVVLSPDSLVIEMSLAQLAACELSLRDDRQSARSPRPQAEPATLPSCRIAPHVEKYDKKLIVRLCTRIKRMDRRRVLVSPEGRDLLAQELQRSDVATRSSLVRAVGQAYAWRADLLRTGCTIRQVAEESGVTDAWVNRVLSLTQMSPEILGRILSGEFEQSLDELFQASSQLDWRKQRTQLSVYESAGTRIA